MSHGPYRVTEEEEAYLGPVAVAVFVDLGWIQQYPMMWSRSGVRAVGNGYGIWKGTDQLLPMCLPEDQFGAAYWNHRQSRNPFIARDWKTSQD